MNPYDPPESPPEPPKRQSRLPGKLAMVVIASVIIALYVLTLLRALA